MAKMATWMMQRRFNKADYPGFADMLQMALQDGVRFVACKMTIDMMEIKEEKLIEGVVVWTAEDFLKYAKDCKICLFT